METNIMFRMKLDELIHLREKYNKVKECISCLTTFDESHIKIVIEYEGNNRMYIPLPRTIASDVKGLVLKEYQKEIKDITNEMDIFLKQVDNY